MPRYSLGGGGGGGDAAITAINNAAENLIVTVGSTTTELEAEATLTFASNKMIPTASAHNAVGTALAVSAGATTAGTTNNIAGGALTIQGGQGKGSGAGGDIIFQTANAGGSGSTINALATALTLSDDLSAAFTGAITGTTIDASTDFTIGDTVITDGVITDSSGLQLAANLDINGTADISGDLTLSAGADGALVFSNAGENSIKIPDNQGSALIIEEADNAYITFTTTNSSEAITVAKATTFSAAVDLGSNTLTSTGSMQVRTIDYSDGDNAITIADGGGMTMAQNVTMAGAKNVILGEASTVNISVPTLSSADHTVTGITAPMLAGGDIGAFKLVCMHTVANEVVVADASAVATARAIGIQVTDDTISDGATATILLHGFVRDDTFNFTPGSVLFLSETAGAMTHTAPTTDGAFVQAVGIAMEVDVVYINPSLDIIEHA